MKAFSKNRLQMFRRVRDLLRSDAVPPDVEKSLANFEATIDRLTELAAQQELQGRLSLAATQRTRLLALQLKTEMMKPVVRIGGTFLPRAGAEAESIRSAFAMRSATDYEGLIASAEGMARLVVAHEAQFTQAGLPAGHAKALAQAAADLRTAINTRGQEVGKRSAATSGATQATSEGTRQLHILAALVLPKYRANAEWLAKWRTATVVARGGGRPADAEQPPVPGTPTTPATPTPTQEVKAA